MSLPTPPSGGGPLVVLIDSGLNPSHPYLRQALCDGVAIGRSAAGDILLTGEYQDRLGHGTAMGGLVVSHCRSVRLFAVRLFDSLETLIDEELLLAALQYVEENIPCDILNLSLGLCVSEHKEALREQCLRLRRRGTLIVSAFENSGAVTYPAAFDGVIGVTTGDRCLKSTDYERVEDGMVDLCACGRAQRVAWVNPDVFIDSGNSLACAHVSGLLAQRMCEGGLSAAEAYDHLCREMPPRWRFTAAGTPPPQPPVGSYRRAVLFPFNKEIHSLVRYARLLPFTVEGVCDLRVSGRVGAHTARLLPGIPPEQDQIIGDIDALDWSSFDTLILGHTRELSQLIREDTLLPRLLQKAAETDKYVYAFDDLESCGAGEWAENPRFYFPRLRLSDLKPPNFGKLYRPWLPVAAVFGTSSRQGKFTLQLLLREKLLRRGYRLGQIGTEPSAPLFGMEACFHFGFDSSSELSSYAAIAWLNQTINELSEDGAELILTGCQSEILPHDTGNLGDYPLHQLHFLMGVQPDIILLCVNPFDEESYLRRCIHFLESAVDSRVAALVVFPLTLRFPRSGLMGGKRPLTEEEFLSLRRQWEAAFDRPVLLLEKEEDMEALTDIVIDYFADETDSEEKGALV